MGLDYKKLEENNLRLENREKEETFQSLPTGLIHFLNNDVLNHVLCEIKHSKSEDIPSRVLNNWIKEEVVIIDENDRGKVKRFNKLQCIWLNIVDEARKYGMYLDELKKVYREIMVSPIPNFNYLKLAVIHSVFLEPQVLVLA